MRKSVPVLYYHRVGAPDPIHLSIPCDVFDKQMAYLKKKNFNVISSSDLFAWITSEKEIQFPAVCITFDDGFLDNLVYADKILKKYQFKASLFMATSLIRPECQDAADELVGFNEAHTKARRGDLSQFLSVQELKQMQDSKTWEIYSHSHAHNQVFTSTEITGTYPVTDNHWGILSAYKQSLPEGNWPVFKRGAGLVNKGMKLETINPETITKDNKSLKFETGEEYTDRVRLDLKKSLDCITKLFPTNPPLICWPWGKADSKLETLAHEEGYKGAFRTDTGANYKGMNPMQIRRFAIKKSDLFRFALGISLRSNYYLAETYAFLRNL